MLCHYVSDLHFESQDTALRFPGGDLLIIAGDLCNANRLNPALQDRISIEQRSRVMRFIDGALAGYRRVLLVPGNHDHYEGVIEDTATTLRHFLPGVGVLDGEATDVDGVGVFGTTLWTDFDGGEAATLAAVRRRMGEYFFVKTRSADGSLRRFEPGDALVRHRKALTALKTALDAAPAKPWIVVSHHSPSRLGANTAIADNGLDAAYFSRLDSEIEALPMVSVWVHGHTHVARTYRVGAALVASNALGFVGRGLRTPGFSASAGFRLDSGRASPVSAVSRRRGRSPKSRATTCDG